MGSGPLGTLLALSWKGSSALKSSRVLPVSPPAPATASSILRPPIAGADGLSAATTANDTKTRTPNKTAAADAHPPDAAGPLIAPPTRHALLASSLSSVSSFSGGGVGYDDAGWLAGCCGVAAYYNAGGKGGGWRGSRSSSSSGRGLCQSLLRAVVFRLLVFFCASFALP
ncbi:hypothetical protein D1007_14696 [Hordeum vulgare]|nr:hypothetical protein D1007_14696 [Hordeum vulgare]